MTVDLIRPNPCELAASEAARYWHGRTIAHGDVSTDLFTEKDVARVIAQYSDEDCWDGEVAAVVQLRDGRFVSWETFYGPTGDGFSEGAYGGDADVHFALTLDDIVRWGLTDESRKRLGFSSPN